MISKEDIEDMLVSWVSSENYYQGRLETITNPEIRVWVETVVNVHNSIIKELEAIQKSMEE